MRILKYIFLLLLLASFAFGVFVSTQKGDYQVSRSKIINSKKEILYSYINDQNNLKNYNSWNTSLDSKYSVSKKNTGIGSKVSWQTDDLKASLETISVLENQKISQQISFDKSISKINWILKDTLGKTKLTIQSKGVMPFGLKVYNYLNGGSSEVIGQLFDKSLSRIEKNIKIPVIKIIEEEAIAIKPLDTFAKDSVVTDLYEIKIDTIVSKVGTYYAAFTLNSKISNIQKNFKIIVPKVEEFIVKNRFIKTGKPFIIFNSYNSIDDFSNFSVSIPVAKNYLTKSDSEIKIKKYNTFQALKATLTGNTIHLDKTYGTINSYMKTYRFQTDTLNSKIELYSKSIYETQDPKNWETVIYIPISPKKAVAKIPFIKRKPITNTVKLYPDSQTTLDQPKPETPKKTEEVPNYESDN